MTSSLYSVVGERGVEISFGPAEGGNRSVFQDSGTSQLCQRMRVILHEDCVDIAFVILVKGYVLFHTVRQVSGIELKPDHKFRRMREQHLPRSQNVRI